MTVADLLADLASRDIRLRLDGDKLRINAPKGVLTRQLQAKLVKHKPEILTALGEATPDPATVDWAEAARRLLATCPYRALRADLTDFFRESAARLEREDQLPCQEAKMQAFGLLLFEILLRGIDAKTAGP